VSEIVVAHKDRLVRFGFDWFEKFCHDHGETILVMNLVDRVAALNYARRYDDQEIERYTPYRKVQTILLSRFHRRLEAEQSATVSGRTLETVQSGCPPQFVEVIAIAGREKFQFQPGGHSESETNEYV
jgi:hypothetical protein